MNKIFYLLLFVSALIFGCTELKDWADAKDSIPPGKVINPVSESLPGGARITYSLPADKDLLGVKAVYSFSDQDLELREAFSSAFKDTIEIYGFPDTKQRSISLYCIDKSGNESEAVSLTITPTTPPVQLISESLKLSATFGGVLMKWENEYKADVAISLFAEDSIGEMKLYDTHYTSAETGAFSFRGFNDKPRKFQIITRDRWGNYSTPIEKTITPLYETEILSRDQYGVLLWQRYGWSDRSVEWRGDIAKDTRNGLETITDGITVGLDGIYYWSTDYNYLATFDPSFPATQTTMPAYFTIDLGQKVSLSRHKLWMRGRNSSQAYLLSSHRYFQQGAPKYYEIWGCENEPKQPGDFASKAESLAYWTGWAELGGTDSWKNDWIKLADCENLPISGAQTTAELTVEDIIAADNGYEANVSPELSDKKIRYLRFVFKENWEKTRTNFQMVEIKFFGAYEQ